MLFFASLFSVILLASSEAVTEGPACETDERYQCNGQIGLTPEPTDCHVFYNCDLNIQTPCPSTCPPGLAFDPTIGLCNWESLVATCNAIPRAREAPGPACDDSERYSCNGGVTAVADPNDCTVFYNCDSNIQNPCPSSCPPGLGYDEALGVCNWMSQVASC
uniref:protein obstructor-E n=1 Tax=Ciona intestinalis TaxID=7719 RepID=UPI00006A3480|nr:protein obstructor-E [Ciona intestinalis]|eukprot:XP_002131595.1 protein obstructor-E [Ciona intestinalis]